jgi:hypothetical protein
MAPKCKISERELSSAQQESRKEERGSRTAATVMFDAVRPRDVDKLLPVTDGQLAQKDKEYLVSSMLN